MPKPTRTLFAWLMLLSACGSDESSDLVANPASPAMASDHAPETPSGAAGQADAADSPRGIRVIVPSHCGVLSAAIQGELWLAAPPLGKHNPPAGWDENETVGRFVQTSPTRGTFRGEGGQTAEFRLADPGAADPNLGCE